MHDKLTNDNFLIYCAKFYDNPQCHSTEEFFEDLNRIKYIKKLITRYVENSDLRERLILNHLIVLSNVFGAHHLCRILYLKLKDQFEYVKPFLLLLNILPDIINDVGEEKIIYTDMIPMNEVIIKKLRELNNG